jgi:hypothetical protein
MRVPPLLLQTSVRLVYLRVRPMQCGSLVSALIIASLAALIGAASAKALELGPGFDLYGNTSIHYCVITPTSCSGSSDYGGVAIEHRFSLSEASRCSRQAARRRSDRHRNPPQRSRVERIVLQPS